MPSRWMQSSARTAAHRPGGRTRRVPAPATLVLAGLLAAACAPKLTPAPLLPETLPAYRVGTPDKIRITVLPDPIIVRDAVVRPDGRISMDLIGDVDVAGRTVQEIARDIEVRIARYKRDPKVTVSLESAQSTEITILGEVGRPQTVVLARETRVMEAIGRTGGTSRFADKNSTRIIRFDGEQTRVIPVDLAAIEKGDLSTNVLVAGGDIIVVPPNWSARIGYAVNIIFFPLQQVLGLGGSLARVGVGGV